MSEGQSDDNNKNSNSNGSPSSPSSTCSSSLRQTAWQSPWILMILALYVFCLPWIAIAIVHQYWVEKDYDASLAGLDDTPARQFFMLGHMSLGAVCLLLGPTQFLPSIRRKWPSFHRWSGRIYVLAAVLCSIFGLIFICLKGFILVGGLNMGFAFFVAGVVFGVCALLTAVYARKRDFLRHRNWAIRAYSQVLAPMLYRYFYFVLGGLGLYPDTDIECNEEDICHPFTQVFDMIHAWTYFIFPLLCAELIIYCLPSTNEDAGAEASKQAEANLKQVDDPEDSEAQHSDQEPTPGSQEIDKEKQVIPQDDENPKETIQEKPLTNTSSAESIPFDYSRLNILGIIGAVCSVASTVLIYAVGI